MWDPALVCTQAAGLVEESSDETVAEIHAYMTAKVIMDNSSGRHFHIAIVNFGKVDVYLLKHQMVGKVADVAQEIVLIEDERVPYLSGAHVNNSDISVNSIHYKSTPDRLAQLEKHEAVKEKYEEKLKMNWREDALLSAKFRAHRLPFLEMLR